MYKYLLIMTVLIITSALVGYAGAFLLPDLGPIFAVVVVN